MPDIQWTILYFGICLDCDYAILEAIEMNWLFDSFYAIWCRLPENYSHLDLISPVQEILDKFEGSWRYHRSKGLFQASKVYKVESYFNVHMALQFLDIGQQWYITEFYQIDYDLTG